MTPTTTTKTPAAPTWELDSIFPGGSRSAEFKTFRDKVKAGLAAAATTLSRLPQDLNDSSVDQWSEFILVMQTLAEELELVQAFAGCLSSQDVSDVEAIGIESEGDLYVSQWDKLKTKFESMALKQPEDAWQRLVSSGELVAIQFYLNEMRNHAKEKMPVDQESLALDLSVNGYHAWNRLYDKMAGDLTVSFSDNGESQTLSLGQLATKMSDPERAVRAQAFEKMTEAWKSRADLAAMALNAQAGFRLSLYEHRKWNSALHEPLAVSRMKRKSLDAMWSVISDNVSRLQPYIDAKKRLLGIDKFAWFDQFAPCGSSERTFAYDEASDFIVNNVREFSDDLADFCRMAIDKKWIEAEDRAGKGGGGFCTGMGPHRQSRIFMTYAGTYENLLTLAHELGHAYHSHVLKKTPYLATVYPMTLAETASIFSELLVTDAAMKVVSDEQEKLMLLDQKLQQAYVFFTDLQSRYLFERKFYEERKKGVINQQGLCDLMVEAQREAFGSLLDESGYHPLFWASKLHFFITDYPFYNFPYTVGYLFAGGVYDRARGEGSGFADKYRALLADTGKMTTEQVAKKHLGVDLTGVDFWKSAVERSLTDVDKFVSLAATISKKA